MHLTIGEKLKKEYGKKVYKLSLDAGCSCPNRDGTKGTGGCIFCSDEAYAKSAEPLAVQIEEAKKKVGAKTKDNLYIAYFQNHTNTYGDVKRLEEMFSGGI